jgi:ABC-type antimicrobial peptide transport system permease subunit
LLAFLSTFVGGIAAALAATGIYGMMSFSMARRTREIGMRLAVGAERRRIFAQTLQESAATLIAGVVLGVPLALGLSGLVFGLKPVDPLIIVAVVVIGLMAMIAAAVPASAQLGSM